MIRIDTPPHLKFSLLLFVTFLFFSGQTFGQTNLALTAVATHSGGGVSASGYGPELYNNNLIPAPNTTGTFQWGWVSTNGWIEFTWASAVSISKVKVYKQNRPMTTCVLQYWNGTAYVNIMTYNNASAPVVDSMVFPTVSTTKLRLNSVAGSSNPNHGEIQIFGPSAPNDLSAKLIISPLNNSQNCFNSDLPVKVIVQNTGSLPQSNFTIGATYIGPLSGSVTAMYSGTLSPSASDTVSFGPISFQPGTYSLYAYSLLPSDTTGSNDTSSTVTFMIKPPVPNPQVYSDTICAGANALAYVDQAPNAVYYWYSAPNGGTLVHTGSSVTFPALAQDTTMYVAALVNGCPSGRVAISAALGSPPVLELGNDTSFCESIPLVLDAGNAGGKYLWSTGDTSQSIKLTNQSGKYWVIVDKYCLATDTIDVTISPKADVQGISYVRMDNTYYFTTSNAKNVDNYLWIFGDGATSTLANPTHTYSHSINVELMVKLVVSNTCGTDTVGRNLPTEISSLISLKDQISIFPNPATDRVSIRSEKVKVNEIVILNTMGGIVLKQIGNRNGTVSEVATATLPNGNYIIGIQTDEGIVHLPLQIIR